MSDFSKRKRSALMSRIRGKNTIPEIRFRSALHRLGYRFRLHVSNLPGKPDIVLKQFKTAIFINGCFWHQHPGCKLSKIPKTNVSFWKKKLKGNILRQKETKQNLKKQGFHVLDLWECQIYKKADMLALMVAKKLQGIA